MPDLENSPTAPTELPEQSPAPLAPPSPDQNSFINPKFGLREIQATYEMVVKSRAAIQQNNFWRGEDLEPMAMLQTMLRQMEHQYRSQLEHARAEEKEALKRAKKEIQDAGGKVNGNGSPVTAAVAS